MYNTTAYTYKIIQASGLFARDQPCTRLLPFWAVEVEAFRHRRSCLVEGWTSKANPKGPGTQIVYTLALK